MKEKRFLNIFLLLTTLSLSAQVKGVVKDSITNLPIPYVNIWVENENIGTTSELDGTFTLNLKEEKNLVFSALGFEKKIIKSTNLKEVFLKVSLIQMDELVLLNKKGTEEIEIGDSKKINHIHFLGDKPWIYAKLFEFKKEYENTLFINKILFYTYCGKKEAKLKIRIFELNDSIPSKDLLSEDIIVTVKKGNKKNILDVSKYNLTIPKNGVVIGLEWLIIDENKKESIYKNKKTNKTVTSLTYEPSLVVNYFDSEIGYKFYGGYWTKIKKSPTNNGKPWDNKVMCPAINLILTN
jgi:hypothetical protein